MWNLRELTLISLLLLAVAVGCSSSDQAAVDKAVSATLAAAQPAIATPTAIVQPATAAPTVTVQAATATPTATVQPEPLPTDTPVSKPTVSPTVVAGAKGDVGPAGADEKDGEALGSPDLKRDFPGCNGSGPVAFEHSPMRFEDFSNIDPYGAVAGAHVTPIDHMYFNMADLSLGRDAYEVRAIQDGVIYNLQPRDIFVDTGQSKDREWRMDIAHTCTFHSYFDLLTSLEPWLLAEWEKTKGGETGAWEGVPIKSGQVVGRIGGQTLDFGVYDYEIILPGFVFPEHYSEPWKVHTVDPFPYFPTEIREVLLQRNIRKVEPLAGKIDHDIDGKLAGNWFELDTNWYAGVDWHRYWDGHLSLLPEHIDPTQWVFSIGHWPGEHDGSGAAQYLIVHPDPNPRNVDVTNGLVKYELGYFWYCSVEEPEHCGHSDSLDATVELYARHMTENVRELITGVALVQMLEDRLLKVEAFPGMKADDVEGFTSAAKLYER